MESHTVDVEPARSGSFDIGSLPRRPRPAPIEIGSKMRFMSNYYRLNFKEKDQTFYQYEMTFEPELPKDARKTIRKILNEAKADLTQKLGPYVERGTMLWAFCPPKQNLSLKYRIR